MTYDPRAYWAERFEAEGPTYVGATREGSEAQADAFADALLGPIDAWSGNGGGCILDYGCGVGRLVPFFRTFVNPPHACEYVGVDINPPAIAHARATHPGVRFALIGVDGRIPVKAGSVDLVVAVTVLQHVPEQAIGRACEELRRVLNPRGGRVILIEDANPERAKPAPHMAFRAPERYAELLGMAVDCFEIVTAERANSHYLVEFGR